jgi:hypothetical protein
MQYPYDNVLISNERNHIVLDAKVSLIVNAINADSIVPFGDFGGPNVYYFQTMNNGLGNIIYTEFDRVTTLGLASYMVRFGAATTIRQIILEPFPRSQIDLQHVVLPAIPGGIDELNLPTLPPAAIITDPVVH